MKRELTAIIVLISFTGCSSTYLDERETPRERCVYEVKDTFWGKTVYEKVIACDPVVEGNQ